MRILAVLDLMDGHVVHAVGGRRDDYRTLRNDWLDGADPPTVLRRLHAEYGLAECYVADLDALIGGPVQRVLLERLADGPVSLTVDHGAATPADLSVGDPWRPVIASESWRDPSMLPAVFAARPDAWFSLDLRSGRPLLATDWGTSVPMELADRVFAAGCRTILMLDLARVGAGDGTGTEDLLRTLHRRHPSVASIVGGGIRDADDLRRLRDLGADAVLVGSALFARRFHRSDLPELSGSDLPHPPNGPV